MQNFSHLCVYDMGICTLVVLLMTLCLSAVNSENYLGITLQNSHLYVSVCYVNTVRTCNMFVIVCLDIMTINKYGEHKRLPTTSKLYNLLYMLQSVPLDNSNSYITITTHKTGTVNKSVIIDGI